MKAEAKQVHKLFAAFVELAALPILSGSTSSITMIAPNDISTKWNLIRQTAGFASRTLLDLQSNSEVNPGLIVSGQDNIVLIDQSPSRTKIFYGTSTVYGRLTWTSLGGYVVTYYYLNTSGVEQPYTFTNNVFAYFKLPYRHELRDLPTDSYLKLKYFWLNESNSNISASNNSDTWKNTNADIRSLINHTNGDDIGCYLTKSIYQFDPLSTAVDDNINALIPNNILPTDPGRWLLKLTIPNASGSSIWNIIPEGITVTVDLDHQYFVFEDLTISGVLNNSGEVVIMNGALILQDAGEFNNIGTGILRLVDITGSGDVKKEVILFNAIANTPLQLTHHLNTQDLDWKAYIGNNEYEPEFEFIDNSTIQITPLTNVSGRIILLG